MSYQDAKVVEKMNSETNVTKSGHYKMPLPFNVDEPSLQNNRRIADKRVTSLKHKIAKNQDCHSKYVGFMEEMIAMGYAELCKEVPVADHVWYIPHHGVCHPKTKGYAWYLTVDLNTMEST